ncbi:MAG: hypothetical protein H6811_02600 [Phycisphaeraceae bacterium]|nr:hypothetical protein [Phycisphaeraceae bacterium]
MSREFHAAAIALVSVCGLAAAGPVPPPGDGGLTTGAADEYVVPMDEPFSVRSVRQTETANMALFATSQNDGPLGYLNSGGQTSVQVNVGLQEIGDRPDGVAVLAEWREIEGNTDFERRIQAIWTTEDGSALLPFGTQVGGSQAQLLAWNLGLTTDPIEWAPWIASVQLTSAVFFGSFNGGATFPTQVNIMSLFQLGFSEWTIDGAFDAGDNLITDSSGPNGFNYIMTEYTYQALPAPGSAVLILGGMTLVSRRRRA